MAVEATAEQLCRFAAALGVNQLPQRRFREQLIFVQLSGTRGGGGALLP